MGKPIGSIQVDGRSFDAIQVHRVEGKNGKRGVVAVTMKDATPENVAAALTSALSTWTAERMGPMTPKLAQYMADIVFQDMMRLVPTIPPEARPRIN